MSDGRRIAVIFPDDRKVELTVQSGLLTSDLLDLVASHAAVKEKEYFGLSFLDDRGHHLWLQYDRKVLDHDFIKKSVPIVPTLNKPLELHFVIKFYVENLSLLKESNTVEQFFYQVRSSLAKGRFEVDRETAFTLSAWALQATYGDFTDLDLAKSTLRKHCLIPSSVLKEHIHTQYCFERVIEIYKGLSGYNRGQSIVNYLSIAEALPNYGVHFYEVKDKRNVPWWLGVSFKGIGQYDHTDRKRPRRIFLWNQLENLYFRDKKFSIEVHDVKKNTGSRRGFQPGLISVFVWFCASQTLTKALWQMAICQHQFYLDRKHSKAQQLTTRPLSEIVADLSKSVSSLSTGSSQSSLSRGDSTSSLKCNMAEIEETEAEKAARLEMINALRMRKESLELKLKEKLEKLKELCLKEAEITGEMPPELPLNPGETVPQIRRRIGTAFTIPENLIMKAKAKEDEAITSLELQVELQKKITAAALRLSEESSTRRGVRRQRKQTYLQAVTKLNSLEGQLRDLKIGRCVIIREDGGRKKKARPMSDDEGGFLRQAQLMANQSSPLPPNSPLVTRMPPVPTGQQRNANTSKDGSLSPVMVRSKNPISAPNSPIKQRAMFGNHAVPIINGHTHFRQSQRGPHQFTHPVGGPIYGPTLVQPSVPAYALHSPLVGVDPAAAVGAYNVPQQRASHDFPPSQISDDIELAGMKRLVSQREHHTVPYTVHSPVVTSSLDVSWDFGNDTTKQIEHLAQPIGAIPRQQSAVEYRVAHMRTGSSVCDEHWLDVSRSSLPHLPPTPSYTIPVVDIVDSASIGPRYRSRENVTKSAQEGLNQLHNMSFISSSGSFENSASHSRSYSTMSDPRSDHFTSCVKNDRTEPADNSITGKEKVWYETCVDSPVITRKKLSKTQSIDQPSSNNVYPMDNLNTQFANVNLIDRAAERRLTESVVPFESPKNQTVIQPATIQPYREISKPFEMSDFYKYSTKFKKQVSNVKMDDNRVYQSSSSLHSNPPIIKSETPIPY
ncbi:FERM domain-containing protein 4A-like isoform X3 [Artemia franciscana]|uniref:FERM domain-containing protein 4A-like isoform X3 n=1 Tax=Artemia franciscana TaxID=6661 RepID=UPI0032DA18F0